MTIKEKSFNNLVKQMKRCRKCKNLPAESHAVFAGKYENKLMVIGQAPGKQELRYYKPFCGPAGKRLFQWLARVNIEEKEFRDTTYFTQMMKCYPGSDNRGDQKPNPEQLKNCTPFLKQELRLLKPKLVILVGKLAIEKLLGRVKLKDVVGKKFIKELLKERRTIIPLPHPSGASPWNFKKENQKKLSSAIKILGKQYRNLVG